METTSLEIKAVGGMVSELLMFIALARTVVCDTFQIAAKEVV